MGSLIDKRILVVGASAGIGHEVARLAAASGARVAAAARRADRLADLDAHTIVADVTVDEDCARLVSEAADALGGLDSIIYCVGASPLLPLSDATSADWQHVLATNVIGASMVASRGAPHLLQTDGRLIVLSSKSVVDPFPHLSLYSTSKIALDGLLRCLPKEFPGLQVTRVVVGNTLGTEFSTAWDPAQTEASVDHWVETGVIGSAGMMSVSQVAETVLFPVGSSAHIPDIWAIDRDNDDGSYAP